MAVQAHKGTAPSDIAVELVNVSKTYYQRQRAERLGDVFLRMLRPVIRPIHALQGIDLRINRGEIIAYAGANGAGKSTTIKLLSGVLAPDAGAARVFGMDPVRHRTQFVSKIGVVFGHRTELWWDHPVAATYEWRRVVWDVPRSRYEKSVSMLKELLGLHEFWHSLARELSLGQRMRADLGLALLSEPELLLLDEPTIGVDVLAKRHILDFIKAINQEREVTVVVTSHDMAELEQLASRIVMIDRGRIAFDGAFGRLREVFGDRRSLVLETSSSTPPELHSAELVASELGRHEYRFDATQVSVSALLQQAAQQTEVIDVETQRAPIDQVIANMYQAWQASSEQGD